MIPGTFKKEGMIVFKILLWKIYDTRYFFPLGTKPRLSLRYYTIKIYYTWYFLKIQLCEKDVIPGTSFS